jgi:hypothetical protein
LLRLPEVGFVDVVMALLLWAGKEKFVGPKVSEDCLVEV